MANPLHNGFCECEECQERKDVDNALILTAISIQMISKYLTQFSLATFFVNNLYNVSVCGERIKAVLHKVVKRLRCVMRIYHVAMSIVPSLCALFSAFGDMIFH